MTEQPWISHEEAVFRSFHTKMREYRMGIAFPLNTRLPNQEEIKDYAYRIGEEMGISTDKITEYLKNT